MREIAEALSQTEEGEGGGAARHCGAFLLELATALPQEMTAAIATLQPYLESDEVCIACVYSAIVVRMYVVAMVHVKCILPYAMIANIRRYIATLQPYQESDEVLRKAAFTL